MPLARPAAFLFGRAAQSTMSIFQLGGKRNPPGNGRLDHQARDSTRHRGGEGAADHGFEGELGDDAFALRSHRTDAA